MQASNRELIFEIERKCIEQRRIRTFVQYCGQCSVSCDFVSLDSLAEALEARRDDLIKSLEGGHICEDGSSICVGSLFRRLEMGSDISGGIKILGSGRSERSINNFLKHKE